ncbi:mycothiol transferase [Streptomyces sp. CB00455]|uniref:mycothiol transferase n=1 Tax=Streptomyces sp. CB00455 TaxID=1703927 RepID=UPI00093D0B92
MAPSGLSLPVLVRHLAEVERGWFRNVMGGETQAAACAGTRPGSGRLRPGRCRGGSGRRVRPARESAAGRPGRPARG